MIARIFIAGITMTVLGFIAESQIGDPALFQGALSLGGGWIICGLFSFHSKWHGIIGAGVLALIGAARCAPAITDLSNDSARAQLAALFICMIVLISSVHALLAERARRQIEALKNAEEEDPH